MICISKIDVNAYFKKGFVSYSCPIVVFGPWPGHTTVFRGKVISFHLNAADQQIMITPGQIGATYTPVKQNITANQ